jgi:hypothetical protein
MVGMGELNRDSCVPTQCPTKLVHNPTASKLYENGMNVQEYYAKIYQSGYEQMIFCREMVPREAYALIIFRP